MNSREYFGLTETKPKSDLDMETFLKLLAVQMANQNPLEPMNDRDYFAQLAQLGTVKGMDGLEKAMTMGQAASMLGKTVTAVRPGSATTAGQNALVVGVVQNITVRDGKTFLQVQEADGGVADVELGSILDVSAELAEPEYFIRSDQAILLIGKTVTAKQVVSDGNGGTKIVEVTGIVRKVTVRNGERFLGIEPNNAEQSGLTEVSTRDVVEVVG